MMTPMKRKLSFLMILWMAALCCCVSCSDHDEDMWILPKSEVEQIDGLYHVNFYLPPRWEVADIHSDVTLQFFSLEGRAEPYEYAAVLENKGHHCISFVIDPASNEDLPSGEYLLRGIGPLGRKFLSRMQVDVKERVVQYLREAPHMVGFSKGKGTADEPYEIADEYDFDDLIFALHDDPTYARDVYFKQTDNILLISSDGLVDENGWFSEHFAGHYDGGGFSISGLYYQGKGNQIGLFRTLKSGAAISNLTLNISSLSSTGNEIGALAGAVSGVVSVSNCTIMGHMKGYDRVGGLFGYASSNSNVQVNNVEMSISISDSNNYVGGLLGYADIYSHIKFSDIKTERASFEVHGNDNVGGLIGASLCATITLTNCHLKHSVYSATEVVTVSGHSYVGGLIGSYTDVGETAGYRPGEMWVETKPLTILNSSTCFPLKAEGDHVGGIAGKTYGEKGFEEIRFKSVMASCSVTGADNVGGFIGTHENAQCTFLDCSVQAANFNVVAVSGANHVGGFIGNTNYSFTPLSFSSVRVSSNVVGSGNYVGGFAGKGWGKCPLSSFQFEPTMKVQGKEYVGGFAGEWAGSLDGEHPITLTYGQATIPKAPDTADFAVKVYGERFVGGLVGQLVQPGWTGTIQNIHARCEVHGGYNTGGLVGYKGLGTLIANCAVSGTVEASGENCGGVIGKVAGSEVRHCINYATVTGASDTGGIIGYMVRESSTNPTVDYAVNVGRITGTGRVGGVVAGIKIGTDDLHDIVTYCANFGAIRCNDGSVSIGNKAYGGIVGDSFEAGSRVVGCANHGTVSGNISAHGVGGIAGSMGNDPDGADSKDAYNFVVSNCINTGNLSNENADAHIGGILGYAEEGDDGFHPDAAVLGCLNKGRITSKQEWTTGGIVGELDWYGHIEYCSCIPKSQLSDYGYHIWEGGVKYDALLWESYRVRNIVEYTSTSADAYKALGTTYWVMPSGTGYPTLKDCPFQHTTYVQ